MSTCSPPAPFAKRRRLGPYRPGEPTAASRLKDLAALARAGFDQSTSRRVLGCRNPDEVEALLRAEEPADRDSAGTD
jgi:hypothetical protein